MEQGPLERFRSMAARHARLGSAQCELTWTVPKRSCRVHNSHPRLGCNTPSWPATQCGLAWTGPKHSVVTRSKCCSFSISSSGTNTAVGSRAPYTAGMEWLASGRPPKTSRAPVGGVVRCWCQQVPAGVGGWAVGCARCLGIPFQRHGLTPGACWRAPPGSFNLCRTH